MPQHPVGRGDETLMCAGYGSQTLWLVGLRCKRSKNKSVKMLQPFSPFHFPYVSVFAVNASLMLKLKVFYVL